MSDCVPAECPNGKCRATNECIDPVSRIGPPARLLLALAERADVLPVRNYAEIRVGVNGVTVELRDRITGWRMPYLITYPQLDSLTVEPEEFADFVFNVLELRYARIIPPEEDYGNSTTGC